MNLLEFIGAFGCGIVSTLIVLYRFGDLYVGVGTYDDDDFGTPQAES